MKNLTFNNINWKDCTKNVSKLQEKIVVAWKQGEKKLVKFLQKELTHSFSARALAVKQVITNDGGQTPGIDKEVWTTEKARTKAIEKLKDVKNYKPLPLLRKYIPKANGKQRPLSIPTLYDRAMQALYLMALDPIAETTGDKNSYGFRKFRSCHDAIEYCFILLGNRYRARWILDADIKGFFDNISHDWILENIPMDKKILKLWLKAGYLDKNTWFATEEGVPQGGIISPTIANMVLDGLEEAIRKKIEHLNKRTKGHSKPKVQLVRYADDFIVTAANKEILTEFVKPAIIEFLKGRGLTLSTEKTKIVEITEGFNFLGFNIRKYRDENKLSGETLLIKPSRDSIKKIKTSLKEIFKTYKKVSPYILISKINPILRGWANYFRIGASKRTYTKINAFLWEKLWGWAKQKNKYKGLRDLKKLYFKKKGTRDWIFTGHTEEGKEVEIVDITKTKIKRHTLVKNLNPYLSENKEYYETRTKKEIKNSSELNPYIKKVLNKTEGICKVCELPITPEQEIEVHHIIPKKQGGSDSLKNLLVLHKSCHHQVTYNKNPQLQAKFEELGITANSKEI